MPGIKGFVSLQLYGDHRQPKCFKVLYQWMVGADLGEVKRRNWG